VAATADPREAIKPHTMSSAILEPVSHLDQKHTMMDCVPTACGKQWAEWCLQSTAFHRSIAETSLTYLAGAANFDLPRLTGRHAFNERQL
jgi:hypothetical protein